MSENVKEVKVNDDGLAVCGQAKKKIQDLDEEEYKVFFENTHNIVMRMMT